MIFVLLLSVYLCYLRYMCYMQGIEQKQTEAGKFASPLPCVGARQRTFGHLCHVPAHGKGEDGRQPGNLGTRLARPLPSVFIALAHGNDVELGKDLAHGNDMALGNGLGARQRFALGNELWRTATTARTATAGGARQRLLARQSPLPGRKHDAHGNVFVAVQIAAVRPLPGDVARQRRCRP